MSLESEIRSNFETVISRIETAAKRVGRDPKSIKLIAVSKKQSVEKMELYKTISSTNGMFVIYGENYVQEFKKKRELLTAPYQAHMIGPLQRNKAKAAVLHFDMIQSVHSLELAQVLNKESQKISKIQDILIQVNISNDQGKSGFAVQEAKDLFQRSEEFPNLRFKGLMTITKLYELPEHARADFKTLKVLASELPLPDPEISMGMSADFEVAIEEGATMVRVGTALFGERV